MPYVTSVERIGIRKGLEQGVLTTRREMVLEVLDERFGQVPASISNAVNQIEDKDRLKVLLRQVLRCASLEEFQQSLNGGALSSGD
jgi:transcription termination factor NusB